MAKARIKYQFLHEYMAAGQQIASQEGIDNLQENWTIV